MKHGLWRDTFTKKIRLFIFPYKVLNVQKPYQAEGDNPVEGGSPAEVDNRDNLVVVGVAEVDNHLDYSLAVVENRLDCILAAGGDNRRSIDY